MWPKHSNDHLKCEAERLKTISLCSEWTDNEKVKLAKYGFYYMQSKNMVKCYFCNLEMLYDRGENSLREHLRWSPGCPLLNHHQSTDNIPIDRCELDKILSSINSSRTHHFLPIEYRAGSYPESVAHSMAAIEDIQQLNRGDYKRLSQRLRSFENWPNLRDKPNPNVLCVAGFFYSGQHDQIRCFSCGGGLEDLNETCDPWELHALWYENCTYLKNSKPISFIVNVKNKYID